MGTKTMAINQVSLIEFFHITVELRHFHEITKCTRYPGENCSEMSTSCQYNLSCASSYVFLTWTDVLGRAFVISVLFSRENS